MSAMDSAVPIMPKGRAAASSHTICFLPQLDQLAVRQPPDVDRPKFERLASRRVAPDEAAGVGAAVRQSTHDRIGLRTDQILDRCMKVGARVQQPENTLLIGFASVNLTE